MNGVRNAVTNQGWGWLNNQAERRLVDLVPSSGNFNLLGLLEGADSQLNFERPSTSLPYVNASGWTLTQETTNHLYTVTNPRSGEVWIFYDFDTSNGNKKGRLKESTTQWWKGAGKTGSTYTYNSTTGLLSQITTPQGQTYNIVFTPDSANRISVIEVNRATTTIMKAEYTYFDVATHSPDLGSSGDLVQVKVSQLTSGGTDITNASHRVERYTQYRYDASHRLTEIFNHDGIYSLIADNISNIPTPSVVLTKADAYSTGSSSSHKVEHFADRIYKYYYSPTPPIQNPSHTVSTAFAPSGEPFNSEYGGAFTNETGMVLQGIDRPQGCSGCGGGGASGVKYDYYYMSFNHGSTPGKNDVVLLVVEDTSNSNGVPVKRRVWGLNNSGNILREITIKDPVGSPVYWCSSRKLSSTGRVLEYRLNSAHSEVDTTNEVIMFLDPTSLYGSDTYDSLTVNDSSGFVYVYEYDTSDRLTGTKIKQGESGTAYYESYIEYDPNAGITLPYRVHTFPTKVSSSPTTSGVYTQYNYTYWDTTTKTRMKTREILPAIVGTGQNGSGTQTHLWEYYDEAGRLRWTKNGEGYVTYRAQSPISGELAFQMRDVDTVTLDDNIKNGSTGKWEAWGSSTPVPDNLGRPTSGLPTALKLVTNQEFDDLGRVTRRIFPRGNQNYIRYDKDKTIIFPYVDSTSGIPLLPVTVTAWDDAHRNTELYAVDPARTAASGGIPTGFISGTNQSHYASWTRKHYDPITGALSAVDSYHNVPDSGYGSLGANFYSSSFLYDGLGQLGATISYVEASKYQVTATLYNMHGRTVEVRRGVATTTPSSYDDLDNALTSTPSGFSGYAKVSEAEYDNGGVGDGYVTSTKQFFGTGDNDCTKTVFYRSFRGDVRGTARQAYNGSTFAGISPYRVVDVDWLGRVTNSAAYTSEPSWAGDVIAGDGLNAHIAGHSTARNNWAVTSYDALGRVYRTERYPGTEGTKHFETNNYYDRRDLLVATGDKYSAHTEMAYDGVGRQYQSRTVLSLSGTTPYSSGAFAYVAPTPKPDFAGMTSGDGGVIELSHTAFDANANVLESHEVELDHNDTDGVSLSSGKPTGGVRATTHDYYDAADRLITSVYYGAADDNDGAVAWKSSGLPARTGGDSTAFASSVDRLVTQYAYNSVTGALEVVKDPAGIKSKTFLDDLGRRTAVSENFVNYVASSDTGAGGGTNNVDDRVTKWAYNGASQVVTLTAVNVASSTVNEVTEYLYANAYNASLVTLTKYPDGNTATSGSPQDNVQMTYNLDGSPATRTDQRGIRLTYVYNDARRLKRQEASVTSGTFASLGVDDSIKSIGRTYDTLGRIVTIGSNSAADGSGTVQNEIKYTYHSTLGYVQKSEQSHQGAVGGGTLSVQYAHDDSAPTPSYVFDDGLRLETVTYPKTSRVAFYGYGGSGDSTNVGDRLSRVKEIRETNSSGTKLTEYSYNGTSRLVVSDYPDTPATDVMVKLDLFQGTPGTYAGFDRFGRTVDQYWYRYASGTVATDRIKHGYDYAGNRLWRQDVVAEAASKPFDQFYEYDGLHRFKAADMGTLWGTPFYTVTDHYAGQAWTLDQLGNWANLTDMDDLSTTLVQPRTHNAANEITGITATTGANWADPAYDLAGNMTTMPQPAAPTYVSSWPFDPTSSFALKYDAWNRLVEVKAGANVVQHNEHDGLGRRMVRSVYSSGTLSHRIHCYYNEQWQLLEERKEVSGTEDTDPLNQYVWHPYYVDAMAVQYWDGNVDGSYIGTNEGTHYFCQDANYNVTAVVNASGTVLERYLYSPYGQVTYCNGSFFAQFSQTTSAIGNTHLYTGRERDSESGLQLNRNRYYASHLGRWLTRDPIGYVGSGWNLYEYVDSRPLVYGDSQGLWIDKAACIACAPVAFGTCSGMCATDYWDVPGESFTSCMGKCMLAVVEDATAFKVTCGVACGSFLLRTVWPKAPPPKCRFEWGPKIVRPPAANPGPPGIIVR